MKPSGRAVAEAAANAVGVGYTYDEMDCQAFVEFCVKQAGGQMDYRGSNDMARHVAWLGTLENARLDGKLVPGALLLIHEEDESGLPARYQGDGLGDFSHVGIYAGEGALTDTDKTGRRRSCDAVHSSASMRRVAGTTLKNGWTHVGWAGEIDYGEDAPAGVQPGAEASEHPGGGDEGLTPGTPIAAKPDYATVLSPDGNPVKLRKSASQKEPVYWLVNPGARVRVEKTRGDWSLVTAICADGYRRRAYMMSAFLRA